MLLAMGGGRESLRGGETMEGDVERIEMMGEKSDLCEGFS
jgi:hypothetical protein